jgi:type IV secretory pathway ATPase VirB11/archaellum biosynthesis ATPase
MRNMSFALTTAQIRNRTKTVTRRLRWATLKPGTLLQPVVKSQGLPKGGTVEKIGGPIRVVSVRREPLDKIVWPDDVVREGFAGWTAWQFIEMFCEHNGCTPSDLVTRIEFSYEETAS